MSAGDEVGALARPRRKPVVSEAAGGRLKNSCMLKVRATGPEDECDVSPRERGGQSDWDGRPRSLRGDSPARRLPGCLS